MTTTVRMNFGDPSFASLANRCRHKPINGYVTSGPPRFGLAHAWTLSVSNGSMTLFPSTGLFFTPFYCDSSVLLNGPVVLRFSLQAPARFQHLKFRLKGSTGTGNTWVRMRLGTRHTVQVPEQSPGVIDYTFDAAVNPVQSELAIESTALEMNLASLSWTYKTGDQPIPRPGD